MLVSDSCRSKLHHVVDIWLQISNEDIDIQFCCSQVEMFVVAGPIQTMQVSMSILFLTKGYIFFLETYIICLSVCSQNLADSKLVPEESQEQRSAYASQRQ